MNKNNQKKILQSIFSLLKNQIKLFQDLFMVQGKQMYNIVQFKEIKNIFDKGKECIKNDINNILSYSKLDYESISTKNTIHYTNSNSTNNSQHLIENKNSNKNKYYNTKTFNEKINNYLIKNEERKITNDNVMKTITKHNETTNNNSSFNLVKQNKSKKNIFNIKFPSLKPKNLNVKKLKIEDFIKLNESNSVSRNLNFLSNSNSKILNVDSFNSSRITHFKKLVDTMKSPRIRLKNINFSPLNISTKNSPIIINQIGLDNSSTTKINNLSNNSIENELSFIKNLKNTSFKNISHHNINFKDKKIPPILLSPSKKINVFKKAM
jgi:hypothetical protein